MLVVGALFLLTFCYPVVRRTCLGIARRALESPQRLVAFVGVLVIVPITLIAI